MPTSLRQQPGKPTITDLPSLIRASALANPDSPAVLSEAAVLTFGAFDQLSDRVAAYLENRGVGRGDRVGLYCINCSEFAVAYFGIVKAGATVVPINVLLTPTEIQFILKDAGVRAWIYHGNFEESASLVRPGIEDLNLEIIMGIANKNSASWSEVIDFDKPPPRIDFDPCADLAAILYTSGTTGKPKGAMLSHANLSANIWSVRQAMEWRPGEEIILLVLPMFHAFAATVGMLACLAHGCAFVPVARFEPGLVLRTISRFSATIYLGVPSMYSLLLRIDPEMTGLFRSIRYCVSGGAALPVSVLEQFEARFGITVYEGDGPTECSPVTCVNPIGGETRPGTVGLPVPGVDMKIVDDEGNRVATGHVGEIAVRGPNVMRGYWNQDEETEAVMRDGWFLTGDLGTEDTDGYFSIVDRKKDLVIVNGMNVYPRIIEEVLYRMDGITEAAVIGQQHDLHGEIPVAYVVASDELDETVIRHWCREHLGRYQVPRKFYLVQSLPKNAAGKILKRELSRRGEYERGVDSDR
ncbi:MAG: long-chain fatty acid--CoA ligase [Pseudomonadota bacterium]|nr:long-chain fatty acid--CoA ligase [Pseudomonadota bacterium]